MGLTGISEEDVLAEFLRLYPGLADRGEATSQCQIATDGLIEGLAANGLSARKAWVRGHRVEPTQASPKALAAKRHALVRTPNGFIDVARRQFDPDCCHPRRYRSEADLAKDWKEIDDGPPDGGLEDERWRTLS